MHDITQQREYNVLCGLVADLDRVEVLEKLNGNCVSAADLIQSALDSVGIKSRILECSLITTKKMQGDKNTQTHFVGYNFMGRGDADSVDTHVVVLVEAEVPFIVDASVGYLLDNPKMVVVSPLSNRDPDVIAEQTNEDYTLTYRVKKNIRLTNLHQKTLLERVLADQKIRKDVTVLGVLVRVLIAVGIFNMVANSVLLILKYIYP